MRRTREARSQDEEEEEGADSHLKKSLSKSSL
jgi:hypothetical protein